MLKEGISPCMIYKILILLILPSILFAQDVRPNIVVVLSDDHRADYLGVAGHPILKTPNIDRLANEGIYFQNAFVTTAACTPNRTCILTGQYERKHGVTFGSQSSLTEEAFLETYPMLLRKSGYFVGYIGKNHTPIGLSKSVEEIEAEHIAKHYIEIGDYAKSSGVMERNFDYWYGNHGHTRFYPKRPHPIYTNAKADTQIEILEEGMKNFFKQNESFSQGQVSLRSRPKDQPFCLLVNFNLPHGAGTSSMQSRNSDPDLYKTAYRDSMSSMALPESYIAKDKIVRPKIPKTAYSGKYIATYNYVQTPPDLRQRMVRTCQAIEGIDNFVGSLIHELKQQGVYDNTIILFTSDHGLQFGEHGLGGKVLLYEDSIRVPFIIFDPRSQGLKKQQIIKQMALSIDTAPTLLSLAGIQVPKEMQGRDLRKLINGKEAAWRQDFFCENMFMGQNYPRMEAVRNERFKYIRYFSKKKDRHHIKVLQASIKGEEPIYEELYDLQNDPQELDNLVNFKKHHDILDTMRQRCQELVLEAKGSDEYPKTHVLNDPRLLSKN